VLFSADMPESLALDPTNGQTLAPNMGGELLASPMTYELDGRYVLLPVQDVLYALALPASAIKTRPRPTPRCAKDAPLMHPRG
jgi:hypothetical protein